MFKFPWCSDASAKESIKPKKYDPSKLSPHFTLQELTKSQTAERLALDNTPSIAEIEALRALCIHVMEHVREAAGMDCDAAALLRLLTRCDALRRPERWPDIAQACECDARGRLGLSEQPYPQAARLQQALAAALAVPTAELAKGAGADLDGAARGPAIARAIAQAREQAIAARLRTVC
jgi:hypothetical protein